jgi:hypothetical protein
VSKTKILDKLSGFSFTLGMIASKIQFIPINLATPFLNLASLMLYLLGYSLWYVSSHFYPEHHPEYTKWYGFAQFKEQNSYAAFLGILGALTSMAALALPVLALPAAWIFFGCNVFWTMAWYHKLKNPLKDEPYSEAYQRSYLSYSLAITTMGLVGALATTLVFIFPAITIPALALSGALSIGLGLVALDFFLDFTFNDHKKTPICKNSYDKMTNELSVPLQLEQTTSLSPYQGKELFASSMLNYGAESTALETCFTEPTCNTP